MEVTSLPEHDGSLRKECAQALRQYEARLTQYTDLLPGTKDRYLRHVRQYLQWLAAEHADVRSLSTADGRDEAIGRYHRWLKETPGRRGPRQISTINNVLAALNHFYGDMRVGGAKVARETVRSLRTPVTLNDRQLREYLAASEGWRTERRSVTDPLVRGRQIRDRLIAELPYYAGLRPAEVVALNCHDVLLKSDAHRGYTRNRLLVHGGTGGVHAARRVLLHPALIRLLEEWLTIRPRWPGAANSDALLLSMLGSRLSSRTVHNIVTTIGAHAEFGQDFGAQAFTPQVLRYTCAHRLLSSGVSIPQVAEMLGVSLSTLRAIAATSAVNGSEAEIVKALTVKRDRVPRDITVVQSLHDAGRL